MKARNLLILIAVVASGLAIFSQAFHILDPEVVEPDDEASAKPSGAPSAEKADGGSVAAAPGRGVGSGPGLPDESVASLQTAIQPVLEVAEYADLKPEFLGARCAPPPCVVSLRFADAGPRSEAFRDHLYGHFVELGAPTGAQPSLVVEDPSGGRQRIWVYWVPPNLDAAANEAMFQQVAAHVLDDRGPDLRAAPP